MPDFLKAPFVNGPNVSPLDILVRLLVALLLGVVVALIYRYSRKGANLAPSFPGTLILLSVLIAMVTQVIGDNVARAFSLVGALSIVRFRTVVRDTQDTAYVIFSVVVGMAVGARNPWVAVIGLAVIGVAAFGMTARFSPAIHAHPPLILNLRVAIGHDVERLLGPTLNHYLEERELMSVSTARQGVCLEVTYLSRLRTGAGADELVKALNKVEGVQNVEVAQRGWEED
jgi:hypothetical protein